MTNGAISLHPENPHYFLFRGKPTVLITSGEHYGAVLNAEFDYVPYLDELQRCGFNLTRLFSGTYREVPGSFKISDNTLAPAPGRYLAPWARSDTPGCYDGGNKFDLNAWDETYLRRLKDFIAQAGRSGVVVELVLFCPFYEEVLWRANPMNAQNNVNGIGAVPRTEVYTLKHSSLLAVHQAATRQLVAELNQFDNLYYELCNEPYFGGVTLEWQYEIAGTIVAVEASLPTKHLIAQNISNGSARIERPHPAVSIFNFHYSNPPDSVGWNYHLNKPIAFDETGFKNSADTPYRTDAWEFILAGGAVYDNLDYSFTCRRPDGSAVQDAPGGGGPSLRRQLKVLRGFIERFEFLKMRPESAAIATKPLPGARAWALAQPGQAYAVYLKGRSEQLALSLPVGEYRAEWVEPLAGDVRQIERFVHDGGARMFVPPSYSEDIALRLVRVESGRDSRHPQGRTRSNALARARRAKA